jgi:hypothetical protein
MAPSRHPVCDAVGVKFGFEQRWTTSVEEVVDLYTSEDFWTSLHDLSKFDPPEVLEVTSKAGSAVTRLRFRLDVELPKEASRFIDPGDVSWVQVTTWDLPRSRAEVVFLPDQGQALMKASATTEVVSEHGDVVRRVHGELRVRIPLLGHRVENVIVEGIGDYLEEEAGAVAERLEG